MAAPQQNEVEVYLTVNGIKRRVQLTAGKALGVKATGGDAQACDQTDLGWGGGPGGGLTDAQVLARTFLLG